MGAVAARRPNVVVIVTDQHAADCVGYVPGGLARTPKLDALAARSTVLTSAYANTPLCVPSRTSFASGRYARANGRFDNTVILGRDDPSLATLLIDAGYALALVGKNHTWTDDFVATWDFVELYDLYGKQERDFCSPATVGERAVRAWREELPPLETPVHQAQPGTAKDSPTRAQTDHALRFLRDRDRSRPFYLHLSYESPHFPYVEAEPWHSMYDPAAMPGARGAPTSDRLLLQWLGLGMDRWTDADVRRIQATYLGKISFVDQQVGRVLTALARSGELRRTIVVFHSDHGDFFGRRGLVGKTNACYETLLRVPLMVHVPWRPAVCTDALVDSTDLLPTLLDLLDLPVPAGVQGSSFAQLLGRGGRHREEVVAESQLWGPALTPRELADAVAHADALRTAEGLGWFLSRIGGLTRSLRTAAGRKVIVSPEGHAELYDLSSDPYEENDLAVDAESRGELDDLVDRLARADLGAPALAQLST